ncbi:MAG: ribosome biogenesis GTPase Der, partial [Treponema sp.]|nr:ribosome biogenesis GTPase Der [Treponema sp.]
MEFDTAKKYLHLPSVVLAGRPNVGKSTLYNRLLHKRRAITDPTPGVTRDPVGTDGFIAGMPLRLIDTGGFKLERAIAQNSNGSGRNHRKKTENSNTIDDLVLEKTLETIKKANLIVLLLEAGEITSEDEEFIALLRPYRQRLIIAVNKTEGGRKEADSWNLLSYGFEKVFMISAEHGDNIGDLEQEIISRLDFSAVEEAEAEKQPIRIALLGKPNTGKSTLSNRLTESEASIVSDIPGTTRDVVEGSFRWKSGAKSRACDFAILDTAGIRRKAQVSEHIEYYSVNRAIKTINEADIVVLLIDAQEGLSEQDKKIAALAHDKGRGIIMAL